MDITEPGVYKLPIQSQNEYILSFEVIGSAIIRIFLKTPDGSILLNRESLEFDENLYGFELKGTVGDTIIFQVLACDVIEDVALIEANQ